MPAIRDGASSPDARGYGLFPWGGPGYPWFRSDRRTELIHMA